MSDVDPVTGEDLGYEIIDIWAVYTTLNERGALGTVVGYAVDGPAAHTLAKGKGWHGGDGSVVGLFGIKIGDRVFPSTECLPVTLHTEGQGRRRAALAKLTDEDCEALGIRRI